MRKLFFGGYSFTGDLEHGFYNVNIWADNQEQAHQYLNQLNLPHARPLSYMYRKSFNSPIIKKEPAIIGMEYLIPQARQCIQTRIMTMHEATFLLFVARNVKVDTGPYDVLGDDGLLHQLIHWYTFIDQVNYSRGNLDILMKELINKFTYVQDQLPMWPRKEELLGYHGFIPVSVDYGYNPEMVEIRKTFIQKIEYGSDNGWCQ